MISLFLIAFFILGVFVAVIPIPFGLMNLLPITMAFGFGLNAAGLFVALGMAKRYGIDKLLGMPSTGKTLLLGISHTDGSAAFIEGDRYSNGYIHSEHGFFKDTKASSIQIGPHRVRPVLLNTSVSVPPRIAQFAHRMKEKYHIDDYSELRAIVETYENLPQKVREKSEEEIVEYVKEHAPERQVWDIDSQMRLLEHIQKNPVNYGILAIDVAGETIDFAAFEKFMLENFSPHDFESSLELYRRQGEHDARNKRGPRQPTQRKSGMVMWLVIAAVAIAAAVAALFFFGVI